LTFVVEKLKYNARRSERARVAMSGLNVVV
jgi:hypothetical protein